LVFQFFIGFVRSSSQGFKRLAGKAPHGCSKCYIQDIGIIEPH